MIARLARTARTALLRARHGHVRWPKAMSIGRRVHVGVTDGGVWSVGENLDLADFASVFVKHGRLSIGANAHIGICTVIACREAISIGDDALIAEHVSIRDQDHRYGGPEPTARNGFVTAPITIGHNVWIGAKAVITKGVTIGDNSVIGAGAVVLSDIPANSVAVGVPARVVRTF